MLRSSSHLFHRGFSLAAAMALVAGVAACGDSTETPKQPVAPAAPAVPPPPPSPIVTDAAKLITTSAATVAPNGRSLSVRFSDFQLRASSGDNKSGVFTASWPLKLGQDEVVVVALADMRGMMMANARTPAAVPGQPVPAPQAGDAVATVQLSLGSATQSVTWNGKEDSGRRKTVTLAAPFSGGPDFRAGSRIPLTISARLTGMTSEQAMLAIDSLDVTLIVENRPVPQPPAPAPVAQPSSPAAPATGQPAPAAPAPAPSQPSNL